MLRDDRRAAREVLEDVPLPQVQEALRTTIESEGRFVDDDALELAAKATNGYPFMIQLVGYHVWRESAGYGLVNFAVPYLRDFLRENTDRYTAVKRRHERQ